ncbi:MAG TPA: phage major capsid protein [Devosia sp.]|nr:phage major capsid protein [Devosia sp.]
MTMNVRQRMLAGAVRLPHNLERKDADASLIEIKKNVETFMTGFEVFKTKNDERLAQIETKGSSDVVTRESLEKLNAELTQIKSDVNAAMAKMNRPKLDSKGREIDPEVAEYSKKFEDYFRKGKYSESGREGYDEFRALEKKALNTQVGTDGGFAVRPEMENTIDATVKDVSPIRDMASVRQIGTAVYKKLVNDHGATSGWVGETGDRPQTEASKLLELAFPAMELYAIPAATQGMLDDSFFNVDQWIADEVSLEFASQEGNAFVSGNGVKMPFGFLAYPSVANSSYAWGKVGYVATGASGDFKTTDTPPAGADPIVDLFHALRPAYRKNASWAMNNSTLAKARKLKDGQGNYLINTSFANDGIVDRLLGKPVIEVPDMPDPTANSLSIAFADFKRAYLIVDRVGIRTLRDPYTNKPYVLFYTTKRVGGGIQNFEAIKLMKFAAS